MNQIGTYCSICERPLLAENLIWNKRTGEVGAGRPSADSWPDLLVLCHNCAECQAATRERVGDDLLLPDEGVTFRLDERSPFRYTIEEARRIIVDENGDPMQPPETIAVALVHGTTPQARNTVERFQLNTPYYDEGSRTLTIPHLHHMSMLDRRVNMRTQVWRDAEKVADTFPKLKEWNTNTAYLRFLQRLIQAAGFWSVWATVLAPMLGDRELIRLILAPSASTPEAPRTLPPTLTAGASLLRGTSTAFLD